MNQEAIEAHKILNALITEYHEAKAKIAAAALLEKRINELAGIWGRTGEIELAKRRVRDALLPAYDERRGMYSASNDIKRRIVSLDEKWIILREDGDKDNEVIRYKTDTGRKERSRGDYYNIDPTKAKAIWAEYLADKAGDE